MKKTLLYLFISIPFFMGAQSLTTENFNSLAIGNVSTNIAGTAPGIGSYYVQTSNGTDPTTSTNATASIAQFVSTGNASTGLQLTGPNGDKGGTFLWKDGLPTVWATRTSGNNIIELEVDINPGAGTTTSKNVFGVYIYDSTYSKTLAGFAVNASTRELSLVAYSTPAASTVGNYSYALAAAPGIQLPANVFSKIGISFNKTTGQIRIKGPGIAAAGLTLTGSAVGLDPTEVDFVAFAGGSTTAVNTLSTSVVFDNLVTRASATDTLLETASFASTIDFSVYPNPANDLVTISNTTNAIISNVEMTDLNGRIVKNTSLNATEGQINISDLSSGVYLMKVSSDQGSTTKKIIKN